MASATGPQARLRAQAISNLWPIYSSGSVWLFGILGDWSYSSPSSHFPDYSRITFEQNLSVFSDGCRLPRTTSKAFQFLGLGFGLSEGGPLPSGVGGVSSKAAAPIFVPSIAVPSRPPRSFWISQIYRSSVPLSLSLSRPHLANDEAHALYHGYACSESTSASLRPKAKGCYHEIVGPGK